MKQIIVAGCGPAGMMAAIAAAREGAKVTILEGMEKPGKKLLVTGNGRCNLTNLDPELPEKYYSVQSLSHDCQSNIFQQFSVQDTLNFFHELGLLTTDRNGYVYPYTGQASSVLDLLLAELKRLKVKLKFTEKIVKIEKLKEPAPTNGTAGAKEDAENGEAVWNVHTNSWTYTCDSLILCCGSKAAKNTGSDGSGYELARQLGHTVSMVVPSLTALTGKGKYFSACAGVRCPATVTLYVECASKTSGKKEMSGSKEPLWQQAAQDTGELQWTDNGISGIVVFQVSRFASLALENGQKVKVELDLLPELSKEEVIDFLKKGSQQFPNISLAEVFSGLLPKKLLAVCLELNKLKQGAPAGNLTDEQCVRLTETMKQFTFPITGVRSFDQCQVCAGGVPLNEVDMETLESKKVSELYFAGELLDVDGPCGGYNLQWAWSSGYTAGKHAARKESPCCGFNN